MSESCSLYRHFDAEGNLLYVGISLSAVARLIQHRSSGWFDQIVRIDIERFDSRDTALAAENIAIKKERPRHNKVGVIQESEEDVDVRSIVTSLRRETRSQNLLDLCDWVERQLTLKAMTGIIEKPKRSRAAYMREYRKRARGDMGDFE